MTGQQRPGKQRRTNRLRGSNPIVIQARPDPFKSSGGGRKFIGAPHTRPQNPGPNTLDRHIIVPSDSLRLFQNRMPSVATEASAYIDIKNWLEQLASGIVEKRRYLDELIHYRAHLIGGLKNPYLPGLACPEIGNTHSSVGIIFVSGSGDQRASPIGYYQETCLIRGTNTFNHVTKLTDPLTPKQIRRDFYLYAALRIRVELRPASRNTAQAVLDEAGLRLSENPQADQVLSIARPSGISSSVSSFLSTSTAVSFGNRSFTAGSSATSSTGTRSPVILSRASTTLSLTRSIDTSLSSNFPLSSALHRNASPPTPPHNTRFETDEENEAADQQILDWTPAEGRRRAREKHAQGETAIQKPQTACRSISKVSLTFYLSDGEIVTLTLPVTKRGICLRTHASLLRDRGIPKAPSIYMLSPTSSDRESMWKAFGWNRAIPVNHSEALIFKTNLSIVTPFDAE